MKKNKMILFNLALFILITIMLFVIFVQDFFGAIDLEQIIFHILVPLKGPGGNFFSVGVMYILPKFLLIALIYIFVRYIFYKLIIIFEINFFKRIINININQLIFKIRWIFIIGLILFSGYIFNKNLDLINYIKYNTMETSIFENYYVDPQKAEVILPKNKNNLIFIIFESLETTDYSQKNGGYRNESIISELEKISLNNLNFSHNQNLGGFYPANGTGFTAVGLTGLTSGLPLLTGNNNELFKSYKYILKNAYSIGEILESEG
ncbi:MAG: hypothetical protein PHG18_02640, partial [Bacilli bacterium]|nr:hypothetical protein [Bacilli bacterium]